MKNTIILTRSVREQAFQVSLGKGVIIKLSHASKPLIRLLQYLYAKDKTLLMGDITALLNFEVGYFS